MAPWDAKGVAGVRHRVRLRGVSLLMLGVRFTSEQRQPYERATTTSRDGAWQALNEIGRAETSATEAQAFFILQFSLAPQDQDQDNYSTTMKFLLPATLALAAAASANAADFCTFNNDDSSKAVAGAFTVYNNVGESNVNAQQCTGVDSSEGSSIAWHTSYNTTGDDALSKSFVVASLQMDQKKLSEIQSIPTDVTYTYTSQGELISNAVYDMYTTSYGHPQYKVMVWLASYGGAKLKSTTGLPIKTATLSGVEFDLYQGYYQNMNVYTFVAKTPLTTFKGDLKPFFSELPADFTEQSLQAVYFGTEAFKGTNAKFSVSNLSLSLQ